LTDTTETTILENQPTTGLGWGIYTANIATTNDTVTLSNFNTLKGAIVINRSDNTVCTHTLATNIITVTQSVTNAKVLILAAGT